jgi:methylmalonyl-CoA mutase N-terminal domain/subunit
MVRTASQSGIELNSRYTPEDIAQIDYEKEIGNPGEFPYTRGIYPEMYRKNLWLKSFIVSYASSEETNEAFKEYIKNGMADLRLLADLPTQSGLDPDHPLAWNSMMCGGVATYALNTYEAMLKDLPLEGVHYELAHSSMSSFICFHAFLVAHMENNGLDITKLTGNSINDPIRAHLVYGTPDFPPHVSRRVCLDHCEWAVKNTPKWKPIAPNGVDPQQGGMLVPHELGEVLAVATAVMKDLEKRGISLDEYGPMVVALDAESDFFETICKFRAVRRMWAKITRDTFGAKTERAQKLKIGIRTSGLSLQAQKPLNNAARVTLQILSSVLGGVNSLDASSIDEAVGLPSYEARIFNLDTQHIVTHEANVPLVADPLGGSYYVEWLTDKIEKETNDYLAEIESRGGIFECLESGWLNNVMEQDRLLVQREKANGKRLLIGLNSFQGEEGPINKAIKNVAYKTPSEELRQQKVDEVTAWKANRNMEKVQASIQKIYLDTKENRNVSRAIIDGVKIGLTVGEITGTIRLGYDLSYDPVGMLPTPDYVKNAIVG